MFLGLSRFHLVSLDTCFTCVDMSEHTDLNFTTSEPELEMPRTKFSTASTHIFYASMSENEPITFSPLPTIAEPEPAPKYSEPIPAVPLAALCPPTLHSNAPQFSSIHEEFLAEQEGLQRMAEKVQEAE